MRYNLKSLFVLLFLLLCFPAFSQDHSIARKWNEVILESIRNDFSRPTVHARNLFHFSATIYDVWSAIEKKSETYFLNKENHGYFIPYIQTEFTGDKEDNLNMAISYAAYRILNHRYEVTPGYEESKKVIDSLFNDLGYDPKFHSVDYTDGNAAALGNYVAENVINYGWQDGSNEQYFYASLYYKASNPPMILQNPGAKSLKDPNRWQPLAFEKFIDQSGNELAGSVPDFEGPEWGLINPFSLEKSSYKELKRDGNLYPIYNDPGPPPKFLNQEAKLNHQYVWNHTFVSIWGSHLDPNDGVLWDISPNKIGNLPINIDKYDKKSLLEIYNPMKGGDRSEGYRINPSTKEPYKEQKVPRGDYTRVIAEFWADGPDSETPPGHWYTILNYVSDHPLFERKFEGYEKLNQLEWDVKSYFILGGALHDAAITAWGLKGYYDYIRPINVIRYLADNGQSSNPNLMSFNPKGIELVDGYVELVEKGDPLSGENGEHIGKIKVYTWRGHEFIKNPKDDYAGVGWILAENWFPYQRPTFVTPNFAGYISGHSTFSRTAAEVLTFLTGDEYFPGGMGEFIAKKNEFLVFEKGPSQDITLQWATYRDASDQCSLSRIWGGIHPPVDDMPGRVIGKKLGINAFNFGKNYFTVLDNRNLKFNDYAQINLNKKRVKLNLNKLKDDGFNKIAFYTQKGQKVSAIKLSLLTNKSLPIAQNIYYISLTKGGNFITQKIN